MRILILFSCLRTRFKTIMKPLDLRGMEILGQNLIWPLKGKNIERINEFMYKVKLPSNDNPAFRKKYCTLVTTMSFKDLQTRKLYSNSKFLKTQRTTTLIYETLRSKKWKNKSIPWICRNCRKKEKHIQNQFPVKENVWEHCRETGHYSRLCLTIFLQKHSLISGSTETLVALSQPPIQQANYFKDNLF